MSRRQLTAIHWKKAKDGQMIKKYLPINRNTRADGGCIHLPVSPLCNSQYRFDKRGINKSDSRTTSLLQPVEALTLVEQAVALFPRIKVAGIAGPGDPLASNHALQTFAMIHERFPQLKNCLATNGLMLREKATELVDAGVKTVFVAMHGTDIQAMAQLLNHINYGGKYMTGEMAARYLLLSQVAGIRKVIELGVTVKVNTVLIPGFNQHQIGEIAKLVASLKVDSMNIVPLAPQPDDKEYRAPTGRELQAARTVAGQYIAVVSQCKACRLAETNLVPDGMAAGDEWVSWGINSILP
ncbi:MAG TPA: radical SAM protein [Negativicutes bacterium]|nr:radical SAM protein [Negativicutes bacterium]